MNIKLKGEQNEITLLSMSEDGRANKQLVSTCCWARDYESVFTKATGLPLGVQFTNVSTEVTGYIFGFVGTVIWNRLHR